MHGAEGASSKTAARGGGRFEFDVMDIMRYVEFDLMDEANGSFKFTLRHGTKRGSTDSVSECGVGGSPTTQDFMNEDLLAATVMRFGKPGSAITSPFFTCI